MKHAGVIFLLCFLLAGCTVPECFDNAPVDKDGSFYFKCEPEKTAAAWSEYCDSLLPAVSLVPGKEGSANAKDLLLIKLLLRNIGINEIKALKMSSSATADGLFSNKIAINTQNNNAGILAAFGKNRNIIKETGFLPADTSDIIAVSVDFTKIWESLKNSKLEFKELIATHSKIVFGTTPEKAAARHSGLWIFSMRQPRNSELISFSVPDKEKHLFNRWKTIFSQKDDIFKIKLSPEVEFFVAHRNGRTELFPSNEELNIYHSAKETMADNTEFQNSYTKHFDNCVLMSWSAKGDAHNRSFGKARVPGKKLEHDEYFALQRKEYGFYGCGKERNDYNVNLFKDYLLAVNSVIPLKKSSAPESKVNEKNIQRQNIPNDETVCFDNLKKLSESLRAYAAANGGNFPEGLHTDGLNKLKAQHRFKPAMLCCPGSGCELAQDGSELQFENSGYVYFGSWQQNNSNKLPILMDIPENHNGFFHVVLRDGTVQKFSLPQQMSIKRMASYMHTVFKYSEKEFTELIRRAGELDKILDKESK